MANFVRLAEHLGDHRGALAKGGDGVARRFILRVAPRFGRRQLADAADRQPHLLQLAEQLGNRGGVARFQNQLGVDAPAVDLLVLAIDRKGALAAALDRDARPVLDDPEACGDVLIDAARQFARVTATGLGEHRTAFSKAQ